MKESSAKLVVEEMKAAGINYVVQLPDTGLFQIHTLCKNDPYFNYIPVNNEFEGAGIVAGLWLAGKTAILAMENSGLRVASEALCRLGIRDGIPIFMMMSYRGCFGDANWFAQNHGIAMEPLLQALRIPYMILDKEEDIKGSFQNALKTLEVRKYHVAIVIGGGLLW